jgi:hypothetical protein
VGAVVGAAGSVTGGLVGAAVGAAVVTGAAELAGAAGAARLADPAGLAAETGADPPAGAEDEPSPVAARSCAGCACRGPNTASGQCVCQPITTSAAAVTAAVPANHAQLIRRRPRPGAGAVGGPDGTDGGPAYGIEPDATGGGSVIGGTVAGDMGGMAGGGTVAGGTVARADGGTGNPDDVMVCGPD